MSHARVAPRHGTPPPPLRCADMLHLPVNPMNFWPLLTRLGEAQILLPAAALALLALLRDPPGRRLAAWWIGLGAAAVLATTASKVAFIGWGIGSAALDFTGVSGHAMFAAAVYPLLFGALAPSLARLLSPARQAAPETVWLAVGAGAALALLIGVSRVAVQAHSVSEVVAGLALGGSVCAVALWRSQPPQRALTLWVPALAVVWLAATPTLASASQTHPLVTRLALALAGHERPYTRERLHDGLHGGLRDPILRGS